MDDAVAVAPSERGGRLDRATADRPSGPTRWAMGGRREIKLPGSREKRSRVPASTRGNPCTT